MSPSAAPKRCSRCRATYKGQRCPDCEAKRLQEVDSRRRSASQRGYDARWRKIRAKHLKLHPWCARCLQDGRHTLAQHVDHRTTRRAGGTDSSSNLQSLCAPCHSRKTARDDGGFGNRPERQLVQNLGCNSKNRAKGLRRNGSS